VNLATAAGVKFLMSHTVTALREAGGSTTTSRLRTTKAASSAFAAMPRAGDGLAEPALCRAARHPPAHLPGQGLPVTLPVKDASKAHQVSLTDDEFKLVFSRYTSASGDRLALQERPNSTAMTCDLNRVRCEAIVRRVEELFPALAIPNRPSSGPAFARRRRATCR
jgi:D-amino-acid dehydrogenase